MKAISKLTFVAASLFAAGTVLGQTKPTPPAMNVLLGTATANDTQAAANEKFAELMTEYSGGRLKASVRTGGALGSNAQMVAALQAGAVHGMITPAGNISSAVPEVSLFDKPFLLPGAPAGITAFAAQSKAAAKMMELAEQKGIHIIGFHGIGPMGLLTKFPVNKLADLQGKKFWVVPTPPRVGTHQDWGSVPRPMDLGEVYSALQQGTIDGIEAPPDVLFRMKMHEVAKYFTITEHSMLVSNIIVSKKWFDSLPKDLQDVVTRAGKDTIAWADAAYTRTQNSSTEAMRKVITVTNMPAAELQKMNDLGRKGIWEKLKNDPQRGPMDKLLVEDLARFDKK